MTAGRHRRDARIQVEVTVSLSQGRTRLIHTQDFGGSAPCGVEGECPRVTEDIQYSCPLGDSPQLPPVVALIEVESRLVSQMRVRLEEEPTFSEGDPRLRKCP